MSASPPWSGVRLFGVRHHGPGCARSLLRALRDLQPDCVLIEGPSGCEALLDHLVDEAMQPPVALLSHGVDDPQLAIFHPFAEFSPEWQAMRWARQSGVPVQFIDVPPGVTLAWQQADRARSDEDSNAADASEDSADTRLDEAQSGEVTEDTEHLEDNSAPPPDPLDWLAEAAGFGDGETWWNHQVEERGDGEGLFEAIAQAMTEVRAHVPARSERSRERDEIREACMRQGLRQARKQGFARIAVVCGAWHVPALSEDGPAAPDQRLLKGLEKVKSASTWIPWTYRHLSTSSGYRAGIDAPGWYDYLWQQGGDRAHRAVGWFARIARLLRAQDLDCSSAHLIEASRLADALAALRDRPAPGLNELSEATRSVIGGGDDAVLQLIAERLMIGDRIGSVPTSVPSVPLQRDLEAEQKRLRLKPEALSRDIDLDLRRETDLARSHLLHRLALLGIPWGALSRSGNSGRGTFHEIWTLAWAPEHQVDLILAARYGQTVASAATTRAIEKAHETKALPELAALIDRVLLANLPDAVPRVAEQLELRAAVEADSLALLDALPALANTYRYGNVRQTDASQVAHLFDHIAQRAIVGLSLAVSNIDEAPAERARNTLIATDRALELRQDDALTSQWRDALKLMAHADTAHALPRGVALRLLSDAAAVGDEEVALQLQRNLSQGADPLGASTWLDGFLNRNATVLLHSDRAWSLVDHWITTLADEHFAAIVPLLRRTFSQFESSERRDLGTRVKLQRGSSAAPAVALSWNEERALRALPMLREILGVTGHG